MSQFDLPIIQRASQDCHAWVNELTDALDWNSRKDALRLLRAVLTSIRDHISHDEAAHFAAQLPTLIRGFYFEGWRPALTPLADRSGEAFLAVIEARLGGSTEYRGVVDIAETVALIKRHVSSGEIDDVMISLPRPIRDLLTT